MNAPWAIRPLGPLAHDDMAQAHDLLHAHGWAHRVSELTHFEALVAASQRAFVAQADGRIVGFVRALTDGLSNGYLSMLVVATGWRGRGIGRALVAAATGDDPGISWVLRAGREGAAKFFAGLGFEPAGHAMERRRMPGPAALAAQFSRPIAAVMVPVPDVASGLAWYERAFPRARRERIEAVDFERLMIDGVGLEVVSADEKHPAQAGGSVVYWSVESFEDALAHLVALGATLRRGPMEIERGMVMAQVTDPWGNLIGLRGLRTAGRIDA